MLDLQLPTGSGGSILTTAPPLAPISWCLYGGRVEAVSFRRYSGMFLTSLEEMVACVEPIRVWLHEETLKTEILSLNNLYILSLLPPSLNDRLTN